MIGRLIGIDHGIKRIGIAVSDGMGIIARELTVIYRTSRAEDFAKINDIAKQENAIGFVIGIPQNPNAPDGVHTQADTVRLWIERFRESTNLPIATTSEYLTSEEARQIAIEKRRKPQDPIDDIAARIILQSFLDALSYGSATFPPSPDDNP
jgi:putative Holliday junction resolvase